MIHTLLSITFLQYFLVILKHSLHYREKLFSQYHMHSDMFSMFKSSNRRKTVNGKWCNSNSQAFNNTICMLGTTILYTVTYVLYLCVLLYRITYVYTYIWLLLGVPQLFVDQDSTLLHFFCKFEIVYFTY